MGIDRKRLNDIIGSVDYCEDCEMEIEFCVCDSKKDNRKSDKIKSENKGDDNNQKS